jgi:hypothetical protein
MSVALLRLAIGVSLSLLLSLLVLAAARAALLRYESRGRRWVRLAHLLLTLSVVSPLAALVISRPSARFEPPVKVWSARGQGVPALSFSLGVSRGREPGGREPWRGTLSARLLDGLALGLVVLALAGAGRLGVRSVRLARHCRALPVLRRIGRVRLSVSEVDGVPFSATTPSAAYVVVPVDALAEPARLRLAVRHEIEHLRRRDTVWSYLLESLRAALPWNPIAHAWVRLEGQLQEYACDQTLLARGVPLEAYADCLLWAAQAAQRGRSGALMSPSLFGRRCSLLKRRIAMQMLNNQRRSAIVLPAVAVAALIAVGAASVGVRAAVDDRRVSMADALAIAASVSARTGFAVPVDQTVVDQLNQMVGAEEQRAFWRAALERAPAVRPQLETILRKYELPVELMAVAMVESGLKNLPAQRTRTGQVCAGMWQFIPETVRRYGLRVDDQFDERSDLALETDAAARHLKDLRAEFGEWPLAIAAYTHGSAKVRSAVADAGTRDAGVLVARGVLTPYSARVLAAVLLLERPDLVR